MYYEFTLGDLKEVKGELNDIENELQDQINDTLYTYKTSDTGCGSYASQSCYGTTVTKGMQDKHDSLVIIKEQVEAFEVKIDEIIQIIEDTQAVENEYQVFIYEPEVLNQKIENLKEILDMNNIDYRKIFEASTTYESWEEATTAKLDNPDANIFDVVEETKQHDDEKVFRHNREIMQGLNDSLTELTANNFIQNIENLEEIKAKLNDLEILDDIEAIAEIIIDNGKYGQTSSDVKNVDGIMVQGTGEEMGPSLLDRIHTVLDLVGFYPGIIGMAADVINGIIYAMEWFNGEDTLDDAIFSVLGIIPGLKVGSKSLVEGLTKAIEEGADIRKILKSSDGADFAVDALSDVFIGIVNNVTNAFQGEEGYSNAEKGVAGYFANIVGSIAAALIE